MAKVNKAMHQQFAQHIREFRKLRGISQIDLADEIGVSLNTISGTECAKTWPRIDTLLKIAFALDIALEDFFNFNEDMPLHDKRVRRKVENLSRKLMSSDEALVDLAVKSVDMLLEAKNSHKKKSGK